jgi:hypothetical protein
LKVNDTPVLTSVPPEYITETELNAYGFFPLITTTYSWNGTASNPSTITLTNLFGSTANIPTRGVYLYQVYPTTQSNHGGMGIMAIDNSVIIGTINTGAAPGLTFAFTVYTNSFTVTPNATFTTGNQLTMKLMKLM